MAQVLAVHQRIDPLFHRRRHGGRIHGAVKLDQMRHNALQHILQIRRNKQRSNADKQRKEILLRVLPDHIRHQRGRRLGGIGGSMRRLSKQNHRALGPHKIAVVAAAVATARRKGQQGRPRLYEHRLVHNRWNRNRERTATGVARSDPASENFVADLGLKQELGFVQLDRITERDLETVRARKHRRADKRHQIFALLHLQI